MYESKIRTWFADHREEYLADLAQLVAIPSDKSTPLPGKPFGEGPAAALDCALALAAKYGLSARNVDGYVGLVDLIPGAADRELEILAHLDVVPAGEGWTVTDPFVMKRQDGRLYGRGTADDKGPALAALYAMRAVKELGLPVTKNVRLVLGTDEECGSSDMAHYYAQVEEAPMTFSPDGDFPVINIEKGFFPGGGSWRDAEKEPQIVSISCGVKRNVIPGKARCTLAGVDEETVKGFARQVTERTGVTFQQEHVPAGLEITAQGQQGHASTPERANNALTALLELLCVLPLDQTLLVEQLNMLHNTFPHGDWKGEAAGVAVSDQASGNLTISLNLLQFDGQVLSFEWDSRVPVCAQPEKLDVLPATLAEKGFDMWKEHTEPHCVPEDTPFVQTLLKCYETYTGLPGYGMAIGGGTYVHELKNGVAFGCTFPGTDNHMHGADEMAVEEELLTSGEIFAEAIAALCGD